MSSDGPFVCELVSVTWQVNDHVATITYEGKPLAEVVNNFFNEKLRQYQLGSYITLTAEETALISNLLDTVTALPANENHKKLFLADKIFEHLVFEVVPPYPKFQSILWRVILDYVWQWEDSNEKVHKGTAYYFMALSYLRSGDIPSAYICFFNALEDDKRNYPHIQKNFKDGPAYYTTSLVNDPRNALFSPVVVPLREMLQSFIDQYNSETGKNLTLSILDTKFLQADPLEDIKRVFVATFHEIYHLAPLNSTRMINNDYSKLKVIDSLFNMCLVIDQILEHKFSQAENMGNAVYQLSSHLGWTSSQTSIHDFFQKLIPQLKGASPDTVLPAFLDGTCTYDNAPIDYEMRSILAAYSLRNYRAHNLEGNDVLVSRYDEVLRLIMHAFFISVETL